MFGFCGPPTDPGAPTPGLGPPNDGLPPGSLGSIWINCHCWFASHAAHVAFPTGFPSLWKFCFSFNCSHSTDSQRFVKSFFGLPFVHQAFLCVKNSYLVFSTGESLEFVESYGHVRLAIGITPWNLKVLIRHWIVEWVRHGSHVIVDSNLGALVAKNENNFRYPENIRIRHIESMVIRGLGNLHIFRFSKAETPSVTIPSLPIPQRIRFSLVAPSAPAQYCLNQLENTWLPADEK